MRNYCDHCAAPHVQKLTSPQTCVVCGHQDWTNPTPVVMCVQPVVEPDGAGGAKRCGLLAGIRAIAPAVGTVCLLAGHVELGESAEQAAARELAEESGVVNAHPPHLLGSYNPAPGGTMLLAALFSPITYASARHATPGDGENSEILVVWGPETPLGFPVHQKISAAFFANPADFVMLPW